MNDEVVATPAVEVDPDAPISAERLAVILEKHAKWLKGEVGGEQANLAYANLTYADLRYANLTSADLTSADLRYANLTSANLTYADLRYANLAYANLDHYRLDLITAILRLPDEIPFLRQKLVDGKIDGTTYEGECACLAGTLCNARGMEFKSFEREKLMPVNASSPRELWFWNIRPGHTPENSSVAKVTLDWIDEALHLVSIIRKTVALVGATVATTPGTGQAELR